MTRALEEIQNEAHRLAAVQVLGAVEAADWALLDRLAGRLHELARRGLYHESQERARGLAGFAMPNRPPEPEGRWAVNRATVFYRELAPGGEREYAWRGDCQALPAGSVVVAFGCPEGWLEDPGHLTPDEERAYAAALAEARQALAGG
jgi:hypothetical protein